MTSQATLPLFVLPMVLMPGEVQELRLPIGLIVLSIGAVVFSYKFKHDLYYVCPVTGVLLHRRLEPFRVVRARTRSGCIKAQFSCLRLLAIF